MISSVDPRGGGPIEVVLSTADVWIRHGHECHIVCLDTPTAPWLDTTPVTTFAVGSDAAVLRALPGRGYAYTPRLVPWLRQHARAYDAIIVHGLWNYASYGSWRALGPAGIPYFAFVHGMLDPWFKVTFPVKAVLKAAFWRLFENKVLRDARGVLFTNALERDLAAQSFAPYAAQSLVVGLGARDVAGHREADRERLLTAIPRLESQRFILFLSRIHPKKGIDLLINAFADLASVYPDLDLVIAGPDQVGLQRDLEALAAKRGVADRVHWPGMLTGDAKWAAFGMAEFFALPSHQENFGIAVAEALALGIPVLVTNKVNIWNDIATEQAGVVVDDDLADVSCGLRRLCAMSAEERGAMSLNARQCFVRHFDLERVSLRLLDVIAEPRGAATAEASRA